MARVVERCQPPRLQKKQAQGLPDATVDLEEDVEQIRQDRSQRPVAVDALLPAGLAVRPGQGRPAVEAPRHLLRRLGVARHRRGRHALRQDAQEVVSRPPGPAGSRRRNAKRAPNEQKTQSRRAGYLQRPAADGRAQHDGCHAHFRAQDAFEAVVGQPPHGRAHGPERGGERNENERGRCERDVGRAQREQSEDGATSQRGLSSMACGAQGSLQHHPTYDLDAGCREGTDGRNPHVGTGAHPSALRPRRRAQHRPHPEREDADRTAADSPQRDAPPPHPRRAGDVGAERTAPEGPLRHAQRREQRAAYGPHDHQPVDPERHLKALVQRVENLRPARHAEGAVQHQGRHAHQNGNADDQQQGNR